MALARKRLVPGMKALSYSVGRAADAQHAESAVTTIFEKMG
jgi:hypothetical protein